MKITRINYRVLFLLILINIGILLYLRNTNFWTKGKSASKNDIGDIANEITVILYDFEHFENNVVNSVDSILTLYPKINILVVSEEPPYPPLKLSSPQVKVKTLNIQPNESMKQGRPEEFIKTEYALFLPDGFLLKNKLDKLLKQLVNNDEHVQMVATGAKGPYSHKIECEDLTFDTRRWTLQYIFHQVNHKNGLELCNSIVGDVAVLIKTVTLKELSAIFLQPFLQALYIQLSLRNWKVGVIKSDSPFEKNRQLYSNEHNRWKHERNQNQRKKDLYKRFGIKKVQRDGFEEWYGCDKNTARCFGTIVDDVPSFIYDGKWTPPCCLNNVRTTARHVFETFHEYGIAYWLEGGSLLGAARHGDVIPWDYDVDIGMYKRDIDLLPQLKQAKEGKKFTDAQGFVWEKSGEGDFFRVQYSATNHMHIDIFPFYEKNGIMTKDTWFKTHRQDTEFPEHYLMPLERIKFIGMQVSVPNNHREFLEFKFGKGVIENPKYPNSKRVQKK